MRLFPRKDSNENTLVPQTERTGARTFREQFIGLVRFLATPVVTAAWSFYFAHAIHPTTAVAYLAIPALALGGLMLFVRPFAPPVRARPGFSLRRTRMESIILYVLLDMLVFPAFFGHVLRGILADQLVTSLIILGLAYTCCRFFLAPLAIARIFKGRTDTNQEEEEDIADSSTLPSTTDGVSDEDSSDDWYSQHGQGD